MAQRLIQEQTQKQQQLQRLSSQQMLQIRLLSMPIAKLEEHISAEIDDNPALEPSKEAMDNERDDIADNDDDTLTDEQLTEKEDRKEAMDDALEGFGKDDEMPTLPFQRRSEGNADYEEMMYGDTTSFYDKLKEQMAEMVLTEEESNIMEYLIGSLDDDGLLRKSIDNITDELAIYNNIYVSQEDVEKMLGKLQTFDPAGIGARSLKECLLLQIERKKDSRLKELMRKAVDECLDDFTSRKWGEMKEKLGIDDMQLDDLLAEIKKLNPKPGASLGETESINSQQIIPDFIVDTSEDGDITFYLNQGNVPELTVSPSFTDMMRTYRDKKESMSQREKDAYLYIREKVEHAQGFIYAVEMRRQTLYKTMKAIIEWQQKFFRSGDELDLKPMTLKDISAKTGLDKSTISRVSNIKYAQTRWGIFPLRYFFNDKYTNSNGEEASAKYIVMLIKELIDNEDGDNPLSDEALSKAMKDKGYSIARRTIAKYREKLGIPSARTRKHNNQR